MLDNRIKPKIFVPFIERGFIFVQYSQLFRQSAPNVRVRRALSLFCMAEVCGRRMSA